MNLKRNILVQSVLLLSVAVFSLVLKQNSSSSFLSLIKFTTYFGVLVSFGTTILAFRLNAGARYKELSFFALTGTIIAALAIADIQDSANFGQTLNILRYSSVFALMISVVFLLQIED